MGGSNVDTAKGCTMGNEINRLAYGLGVTKEAVGSILSSQSAIAIAKASGVSLTQLNQLNDLCHDMIQAFYLLESTNVAIEESTA
jgi:hypothetical protein